MCVHFCVCVWQCGLYVCVPVVVMVRRGWGILQLQDLIKTTKFFVLMCVAVASVNQPNTVTHGALWVVCATGRGCGFLFIMKKHYNNTHTQHETVMLMHFNRLLKSVKEEVGYTRTDTAYKEADWCLFYWQ